MGRQKSKHTRGSISVAKNKIGRTLPKITLPSETKPYEFNLTIKINDMNQLINDLKTLIKNNWKTIALIVIIIWLVTSYTAIKSGIIDGWNGK